VEARARTYWFAPRRCVVLRENGRRDVFVGAAMVGQFEVGDFAMRNMLLVTVANDETVVMVDLARAFGLVPESVRRIRNLVRDEGLLAAMSRHYVSRGAWKVTPAMEGKVVRHFEKGLNQKEVRTKLKGALSAGTLNKLHQKWVAAVARAGAEAAAKAKKTLRQPELSFESALERELATATEPPLVSATVLADAAKQARDARTAEPLVCDAAAVGPLPPVVAGALQQPELSSEPAPARATASVSASVTVLAEAMKEEGVARTAEPLARDAAAVGPLLPVVGALEAKTQKSSYVARAEDDGGDADGRTMPTTGPVSAKHVQFLGAWLLVAMTARLGLHAAVASESAKKGIDKALRLAVDAVTVALGIGQGCVEGVRRLAHGTAAALLLSIRAPSAVWVRSVLGAAAARGQGFFICMKLSGELVRSAAEREGELAVFYVDNHLRPYVGFRRLLYGWRMQDKRAMPGTTDVHVHDADGRPMYRLATLAHDSLGKLLLPIGAILQIALGDEQRILLAFDRAASYAAVMAELRDARFDFVVYEKKPYRRLSKKLFRESFLLDGVHLHWYERGANLGDGLGRVRRISLRLPDGHQINLLAHSAASPEALITIMAARWNQENAFKHSGERWGLNQLDSRTFKPFDPDLVIPSPERRRLNASLLALRDAEGTLHRKLRRVTRPEQRVELKEKLAHNLKKQRSLEEKRPDFPKHCTVEEAGLHGKLMRHEDEYKAVIDTIRTACINAETELATKLAPAMSRPREAKRLLRNLFSASGDIRVTANFIEVVLDVAGTKDEQHALAALCRTVNDWKLTHPGDVAGRPLRFRTNIS